MFTRTHTLGTDVTFTAVLPTVLHTDGRGYWTTHKAGVPVQHVEITVNTEQQFAFDLRVYFDPKNWNTERRGLIYSDQKFATELRTALKAAGLAAEIADDIRYSEAGMQGKDYVSFDADKLGAYLTTVAVAETV